MIKSVKRLKVSTPSDFSGVLAHESSYAYSYAPDVPKTAQVSIGMPPRVQSYVQNACSAFSR